MMRTIQKMLIVAILVWLTACANKQDTVINKPEDVISINTTEPSSAIFYSDSAIPPPILEFGSKQLKLTRIMEGGACKNEREGTKGIFLIYSDPADIKRIKAEQGTEIFAEFEKEIQDLSLLALNQAVQSTEIRVDPFALDQSDAQSKVFMRLAKAFRLAITKDITDFQQKTSLAIEIIPYKRTFEFYINNCEATHSH